MHLSLATLSLAASALAAYIPSEPWTTLTPEGDLLGATTDYTHKFGIQIVTLSGLYSVDPNHHKRVVNQINDGQIQEQTLVLLSTPATTTASVINQIGDGQIQHQTTTASVVNQIGDGQIQHQTTTAAVVNQIGDGQIQHQSYTPSTVTTAPVINQIGDGQIQHQTASVVNQIGDGQIQHQTASVVNQIGDGQIQHQTSSASVVKQISDGQIQHQTSTASAVNQISDGQIQHQTSSHSTATGVSQVSDGQVQATDVAGSDDDNSDIPVACITSESLTMTLKDSVLTDGLGRIGAIVANRQFQFDGPPPQAGSIYAAGWSITDDGLLALGNSAIFFQCKSGDFYNLYDTNVASQCEPVHLSVIELVEC